MSDRAVPWFSGQWMTRYPVEVSVLLAVTLAALLTLVSICRESSAAERRDLGTFSQASRSGTPPASEGPLPPRILESSER